MKSLENVIRTNYRVQRTAPTRPPQGSVGRSRPARRRRQRTMGDLRCGQGVGLEALEPADHGVSGPLPAGGDQAISNWSPSHGAGHGEGALDIIKSSWGGGHGESDVAVDTIRRRRSG
ncbi:hypothetical protein HYQ46_009935 [Verticillium longisporum]|nr:hypothetical protein HYQ46_009935 [Verticillium longisporum]